MILPVEVFMSVRMKKSLFQGIRSVIRSLSMCVVVVLVVSSGAALAQARRPGEISRLKQLYDRKHYFELREAVGSYHGKADAKLLFFRGAVADIFYQPQTSIRYLNRYLAQAVDDEWLLDAYTLLADDFIKIYDYAKAADTYRTILDRLKQKMEPAEIKGYENALAIYSSLRDTPRQTVFVSRDTKAGESSADYGWSVPVEANNQRVVLGLDTGADISLLAKSVAEKLGVKALDQSISMGSITSISVRPKLGFLPTMKIGNAIIHNAIFMVMDDQALTFPDGSMITGVIGFPVIAGLREITFKSDGAVFIPRRLSGKSRSNLCLDASKILFRGEYENKKLTFVLDTGALRSILYVPFLQEFENEIKAKYSLRTEKFTGIGGTEEAPAYILKNFAVRFSGKNARLPEIRLLTKSLTSDGKFFYGNVGQDLIKRLQKMTLDFVSMHITFE